MSNREHALRSIRARDRTNRLRIIGALIICEPFETEWNNEHTRINKIARC
jgi:hypothetical protein